MTYQVIDWREHYEVAKTRPVDNASWCPIPTKQDGLSYRRMAREFPAYYAVFVGIVLACMKQAHEVRDGWLTADGKPDGTPWDHVDLSDKTGFPKEVCEGALEYLCGDRIKWLRKVEQRSKLG